MLLRALRRRPIPAIAAVCRLRGLHAVDKPIMQPAFVGDEIVPEGLRIVRLSEQTLQGVCTENPIRVYRMIESAKLAR
jgi:hypothetical protein